MNILIAPHGTHGDLRPVTALASELKKRNHNIVFCGSLKDKEYLEKYGFKYKLANFDLDKELKMMLQMKSLKEKFKVLERQIDMYQELLLELAPKADLILGSGVQYMGSSVAEKFNIPYLHALHASVIFPSRHHPPVDMPFTNLPGFLNRVLWHLNDLFATKFFLPKINIRRKKMNMKPLDSFSGIFRDHMLLSINSILSPLPGDVHQCLYHTDYWHLFENEELSDEIVSFLNSGMPPVYIGFGSMSHKEHENVKHTVRFLLEHTDLRIVISKGWGKISSETAHERILEIDRVPHSKLFPNMGLIVHHGGAGTTSTALISGVPQLIVPHMADQYYFANRIKTLGIGPGAVSVKKMKKDLPRAIVQAFSSKKYMENAMKIREKVLEQDGIEQAADIIESYNGKTFRLSGLKHNLN